MRGLDGLTWAAEESITSYGVRLRLRASQKEALEALLERLTSRWKPSRAKTVSRTYSLVLAAGSTSLGRPHDNVLYADGAELVRGRDLEKVLDQFESASRFHIAEMSPQCTFLHAGAVSWRSRAIILPGKSGTGKTTLTVALVNAGASYLSDECALIDDRGRIHPFPKPLSIVRGRRRRPLLQPVEALGGVQERRPLPAGLVVLTSYGAHRWRPRHLTPGEGVLDLLRHTVSAQRRPANALRRLERVSSLAPILKGARGEADATAPLILERLEAAIESSEN